jgi:pimeloyl-ACP methyl ester carboxylesterase
VTRHGHCRTLPRVGDDRYDGWELVESGPRDADTTIFLLAGALCTGDFYVDLVAEPALADCRLVAATLPGFAGSPAPTDPSVEASAAYAAQLAREIGADVVVGHSLGANHALEMAASGAFTGPVVLLSPSFSAEDEMKELRVLVKADKVPGLGKVAWSLAMKAVPKGLGKMVPEQHRDSLVAGVKRNEAASCRASIGSYCAYLERHGSLVERLCGSGVKAWVVFGDHDEVGLTDDERQGLELCPSITLVPPLESTHLVMLDQPAQCAAIVREAVTVASASPTPGM